MDRVILKAGFQSVSRNLLTNKIGVNISVSAGDISKEKADIIVTTVNENLQLNRGGVSKALARAAGHRLQEECNIIGKIKEGEVVQTDGYDLPCLAVFLTRCSHWSENAKRSEQILGEIVFNLLQKANDSGYTSIAMPALGTGGVGVPLDMSASILIRETVAFYASDLFFNLKDVRYIMPEGDTIAVDCFSRELKSFNTSMTHIQSDPSNFHHQDPLLSPGTSKQQDSDSFLIDQELSLELGNLRVVLTSGSLQSSKAEAVICFSSTEGDTFFGLDGNELRKSAGVEFKKRLEAAGSGKGTTVVDTTAIPGIVVSKVILIKPCKGKDLYKKLEDAFNIADKIGLSTVAIGKAENDKNSLTEKDAAEATAYALDKIKNTCKHLSTVFIVLLPSYGDFNEFFQTSINQRSEKQRGKAKNVFKKIKSIATRKRKERDETGEETVSASLTTLKQRTQASVAENLVENLIMNDNYLICVREMTDAQKKALESKIKGQRNIYVNITNGGIYLQGMPNEVVEATNTVASHFQNLAEKSHNVKWRYNDGQGLVDFDLITNAQLETLYHEPVKTSVLIEVNGDTARVDFHSMSMELNGCHMEIVRKALKDYDGSTIDLREDTGPAKTDYQLSLFEHMTENLIKDEKYLQFIKEMTSEMVNALQNKIKGDSNIYVDITSDGIYLQGIAKEVVEATNRIATHFQDVIEKTNAEKTALLLLDKVQWKYSDGRDRKPFDYLTNVKLETLYHEPHSKVAYIDLDKSQMKVDFRRMSLECAGRKVEIMRNVVGDKDESKKSSQDVPLPSTWIQTKKDMELVKLKPHDPEYEQVTQTINSSSSILVSIFRVQNPGLYKKVSLHENDMHIRNNGHVNKMTLWHGTKMENIDSIARYGFNRSYCGQNATRFGDGVYFAKDFYYSAQDIYSPVDAAGTKNIFLTKVLVGHSEQGRSGMKVLNGRPWSNLNYDSAVDRLMNPTMFIIFSDTQAYPEYLIKFTER